MSTEPGATRAADPRDALESPIEGHVEATSHRWLEGWAWVADDTSRRLSVELHAEGKLVASTVADQLRLDLVKAGRGDGAYGFSFDLPRLMYGGPYNLTVRVSGSSEPLPGGQLKAGPFTLDGEVEYRGYLDRDADHALLLKLPLEHSAYGAARIEPDRQHIRLVNRLRRERQVFDVKCGGTATLVALPPRAEEGAGVAAWSLQSYPKAAVFRPNGSTGMLRRASEASDYVYFTHGDDVLHPSAAGIVARLPDAPDVVHWNRFAGEAARAGAPGTIFRRPPFDVATMRHGAVTDTSLAVRGAVLARAPEGVLGALLAGRLHPLYFWLSGPSLRWHLHPEALTLGPPPVVDRSEIEADLVVLADILDQEGGNFTLEETAAAAPFPYVLVPLRRAERVSVLVCYRNGADITLQCLASLARQQLTGELEVVLVDNSSEPAEARQILDGAHELLGHDRVKAIRYDLPFNHSAQNNLAAEAATGDVVVICNNDITVVAPTALEHLAAWALQPGIGTVGCRITNDRNSGSYGHIFAPVTDDPFRSPLRENSDPTFADYVHACPGNTLALAAVERQKFLSLGGLNARQFPIGYNDVEFMLRCAKAGLVHLYLGHVGASHRRGSSRTGDNEDLQVLWAIQGYPAESSARFRQLSKERIGVDSTTAKKRNTGALKAAKAPQPKSAPEEPGKAAIEHRGSLPPGKDQGAGTPSTHRVAAVARRWLRVRFGSRNAVPPAP